MKLHIETNLTKSHMNMFSIYTNENIRSNILKFDQPNEVGTILWDGGSISF